MDEKTNGNPKQIDIVWKTKVIIQPEANAIFVMIDSYKYSDAKKFYDPQQEKPPQKQIEVACYTLDLAGAEFLHSELQKAIQIMKE